jgi:phosphopentomutase
VETLDEFLAAVYQAASGEMLVIVTSDHGNFEDFTVKTHTRNAVPTLLWGAGCRRAASRIRDLTDIKPAIIEFLKEGGIIG